MFAVLSFYQLRVIERLWGSRKFAVCCFPYFLVDPYTWNCADTLAVIHNINPPIHDTPPPAYPNLRTPSVHLWPHKLPPRRPYADHLRSPRKLLRRHTLHVSLSHIAVRAIIRPELVECKPNRLKCEYIYIAMGALNNLDLEIAVIRSAITACTLAVSG